MADPGLETALGSLTQAVQTLTQNIGRNNTYAYTPYSPVTPGGGTAGLGATVGGALGGQGGAGIGAMLAQMFLPPDIANRIGTSVYQNSYYREQTAAVTGQLMQERSNQFAALGAATGLSRGVLQTGSMVMDMLSPGTFDRIGSMLDPNYVGSAGQMNLLQGSRLASGRFGGAASEYLDAFRGADFGGLTRNDATTAFLMAAQTGQRIGGGGPGGMIRAAQALGGTMSTVASVFGVEGGDAANIMQQAGFLNANRTSDYNKAILRLGAAGDLNGIAPAQMLQTAMAGGARGGGTLWGAGDAVRTMITSGSIAHMGGDIDAQASAAQSMERNNAAFLNTSEAAVQATIMAVGTPQEKREFERNPKAAVQKWLTTKGSLVKNLGGNLSMLSKGASDAGFRAAGDRTLDSFAEKGLDLSKLSESDLVAASEGMGKFARKAGQVFNFDTIKRAVAIEADRRGGGVAAAIEKRAGQLESGRDQTNVGMAKEPLVQALREVFGSDTGGMVNKLSGVLDKIATALGVTTSAPGLGSGTPQGRP